MSFVEKIAQTIEQHALLKKDQPFVVGVSGGADSVALLRVLHQLGYFPTAAHLNHQLRGTDADSDEAFVHTLADELGLSCVSNKVDVKAMAETSGLSIEMAARKARHDFFQKVAEGAGVALAHHADDQAETFILKLARGAGPDGLSGMSFAEIINGLRIVRPLLETSRSDIIQWLKENNFEWREDASNQSSDYLRNCVRNEILPLLAEKLNPNIRDNILRTMNILRGENKWMEEQVENLQLTNDLPIAVRRRVLRNWLFDHEAGNVDFDAVEQIIALMDKGEGTTIFELSDSQRVVIEYGTPRFESDEAKNEEPQWSLTVESGTGWKKDHGHGAGVLPAEASFNADKVGDAKIDVRSYQPGDRMNPFGMEGSRKLQDIFTDLKIPRAQRSQVPVVVCRDEIIWIPGYRTAAGWEVDDDNGAAVHVKIQ